jgi:hypothetical protein
VEGALGGAETLGSPLEPAFPPIDFPFSISTFFTLPAPTTPSTLPLPSVSTGSTPTPQASVRRPPAPGELGPMSAGHLLVVLDDPIRETRTRYSPRSTFCNQPVLPSFARETWALRTEVFVHSGLGRRLSMHSVAPVARP